MSTTKESKRGSIVRDPKTGRMIAYIPRSRQQCEIDFWERVRKGSDDECWEWIGYRTIHGYPNFHYGQVYFEGKQIVAHRAAWIITKGPIPKGILVCHKCDNPPCCNPNHLFLGTHLDNRRDCMQKKRIVAMKGESHGRCILKSDQVIEIRRRYRFRGGKNSTVGLAKEFKVSKPTIQAIISGRLWKHLI